MSLSAPSSKEAYTLEKGTKGREEAGAMYWQRVACEEDAEEGADGGGEKPA